MFSAQQLLVSLDDRVILDRVSVGVDAGERVALVGANGAGKSTLLRVLAGLQKPEEGRVDIRTGARVGMLWQEPALEGDLTAHQAAAQGLATLLAQIAEYEKVTEALGSDASPKLLHRQQELLERVEMGGGFDPEHRVDRVLSRLGVTDPHVKVRDLSGGGRRRVALAALMVERPEILLLDEPTNHLDVASMAWLAGELRGYAGAVLFITHDRAFLDEVATRVVELDRGRMFVHGASYADYLEGRLDRMDLEARTAHKRDRLLARELSWLRAGTPARTTKQQARIKRAEELLANEPVKQRQMEVRRAGGSRLAKTILEFRGVDLGYGAKTILRSLNLIMVEGQRIGVVGPNGAGKTTLLKAVLGQLTPLTGTVIIGEHTAISYFDQHRELLDDNVTVRESLTRESHVDVEGRRVHVNGYMEGYLFFGDDLKRKVGSLSGGERHRLLLAKLMLQGGNLLLMDEPTNDLDHDSQGVLEEVLLAHTGCALICSHDRRFLDRVATDILALAPDGTAELFPGNHQMYLTLLAQRQAQQDAQTAAAAPAPTTAPKNTKPTPRKLSYREQQELDGMEAAIMVAEAAVTALESEMNAPDFFKSGGPRVAAAAVELEAAQQKVAALYARWQRLEQQRDGRANA